MSLSSSLMQAGNLSAHFSLLASNDTALAGSIATLSTKVDAVTLKAAITDATLSNLSTKSNLTATSCNLAVTSCNVTLLTAQVASLAYSNLAGRIPTLAYASSSIPLSALNQAYFSAESNVSSSVFKVLKDFEVSGNSRLAANAAPGGGPLFVQSKGFDTTGATHAITMAMLQINATSAGTLHFVIKSGEAYVASGSCLVGYIKGGLTSGYYATTPVVAEFGIPAGSLLKLFKTFTADANGWTLTTDASAVVSWTFVGSA